MDQKKIFARNLQACMDIRNISRKELSDALGVSYFTLTDWVKGKKFPRIEKIQWIADYFKIQLPELLENNDISNLRSQFNCTEEEQNIVLAYREIDDIAKEMVKRIIESNLKK